MIFFVSGEEVLLDFVFCFAGAESLLGLNQFEISLSFMLEQVVVVLQVHLHVSNVFDLMLHALNCLCLA